MHMFLWVKDLPTEVKETNKTNKNKNLWGIAIKQYMQVFQKMIQDCVSMWLSFKHTLILPTARIDKLM